MLQYLPEFYREIQEFAEIDKTESVELDDLETAIQRAFDNQFVMTADVEAVKRREKMLGIQADPATETLEFRRKRLINRYSTKPPFTRRYLQEQLDALVGPGMTIVSVDVQNFILYVTANIENAKVFREVIHTVETVKPANMLYQQNTSLRADIGLRESISLRPITWNYRLGSWQLGVQPFATLGAEEVVK
jgi:uncharacterized protein YmfQ (DUF2313 family)